MPSWTNFINTYKKLLSDIISYALCSTLFTEKGQTQLLQYHLFYV